MGGVSLHVMTPTTTSLSMAANSDGTYTAVITVNPTCGPAVTGNDTPQPTGTVHLADTFTVPGESPIGLRLNRL
jgi:hypothetical protein